MQEAGETGNEWTSVAMDVTTPDYTVRNINPRKDYRFRIRAKTENGDISEPTPPVTFYRTQVPLMKDRELALSDYKPVEYKAIFLKHPYYEVLTKYVPPSMPIHKPDMIVIDTETVELSWRPAIVAEAIKLTCNLTYTIEVRCPPSFEWRQLVTGLKICSHTVHKLHPRIDYIFRVRGWNEYGCSEASLPVSLYRPVVYKIEGEEDMDDEEFEREWKRRYGREVPPKLPIDTPRVVTQTSDSIWFTWLPARIPAYATQTNINYVVELREPPSTAWQRDVTDLVDCQYVKEGLNPNQEYQIRVRAETEFGASDPTMPIIIRGKGSRAGSRRSSIDREERGLEDKIDLSYLDNVMSGVPPRMASSRPHSSCVGPDKLTLTWSMCRTPSYVKTSNVTYIIEKRELPGHVWTVLAKDITGHKYDITGLNPDQDYMFRIRARNEFGLSEPTLPMTLYRDRDDYVPPRVRSRSGSRDSISMYVSKVMRRSSSIDYSNLQMEEDRSSQEKIPCQPQYITTTYDTQYGVIGKKGKISLEVRGYPLPTLLWYRGEEKIEYGGQFNTFVTPNGGITLEIKNVGLDTVGEYKCYAENGSGAAVKVVNFEIAEPPTVIATIKDLSALKGDSATLTCKVDGFPSPTIKWMKDWRPLTDCTRTKMVNVQAETFSLEIVQLIESDEGLYACTVENIAGKVTMTGRLSVEIDSFPEREISIKSTPIEEHYHVLEEIGRGRYGVVRRVVEISTGRTFAANFMSMRNNAQKNFFKPEFEVLRSMTKMTGVLKLYDAFESERGLILVTEILSEPELLEKIISDGNWTEAKVAVIIKKLLSILQELARLNILHLDIKPSNIRMSGTDLDEIKLMGFGLSRILQSDEDIMHNYGSVGYASPEQVTNDVLTPNTDMWAVGVMAYLLLSGNGAFQGSSEIEILNFMAECSWTFDGRGFEKFSKEGLDFISKLLVKDPSKRMTVEECMNHPWMSTQSDAQINTEQLTQFYTAEKLQRETEKVFTTVQLQSFAKIIHGAKALYQPAVDIESGEIIFPDSDEYGDYLDEDTWYEWQLQYNGDPDSQIFPIQDKKFTVRECRHAGAPKYSTPKTKERSDKDILDTGTGILFSDKIQPTTFLIGEDVTFMATVVSESGEVPVVTWYRDEQLLSDDYRVDASFNPETGLAKLKIVKGKDYDAAVYKCVARVKEGRVSCEARLLLGDVPMKPGRPLVTQTSGTEAFLTWNSPASDGNAYLLGYRVDYRKEGDKKWTPGPYVTEEYALLTGLEPDTTYIFRASGHNKYGASPFSWSSLETKTLGKDAPKVSVAADLQPLMQFSTFDKQQLILPAESRRPSVTETEEVKVNESDPNENFTFADTISKGSYGEYKLCTNKTTNRQCVAKVVSYNKENHGTITAEFELLHTLHHANLVTVLDSYVSGEQFFVMYEFLSGINVLQYLCLHKTYKEETVARLVRQVLDALQYLEHYGIVHLNLQPSSIVMATRRRPHVKLRDFTLAQKVGDDKGIKVPLAGYPDYTSPEVIKGENVTFTADLWSLGALTSTMLSGISAFGGKNLEETVSRILFDRYSTKEMYDNVTEESVKFIGKLMCRLPRNRPTVTKCLNSSWLNLNESMVNARNSKMFKSEKLRAFSVDYLTKRSDLNYSLALVNIEKLPKITSGPLVQPILSDKITNRLENLTKIKREPTNLVDSLKIELSNLPEQPLLEKIVNKIEKESEIIERMEETEIEFENMEMEKAKVSKTEVKEAGIKNNEIEVNEKGVKVIETKVKEGIIGIKNNEAVIKEEISETNEISRKSETEVEMKDVDIAEIKKETEDAEMKEAVNVTKVKITEKKAVNDAENKEKPEVKEAMNVATTKAEIETLKRKSTEIKQLEETHVIGTHGVKDKHSEFKGTELKEQKIESEIIDSEKVKSVDELAEASLTQRNAKDNNEKMTESIETAELTTIEKAAQEKELENQKAKKTEIILEEKVSDEDKLREKLKQTTEGVQAGFTVEPLKGKEKVQKEMEKPKAKETKIIADGKLSDEDKLKEQPEPTPEGVEAECKNEFSDTKENVEKEMEKTKARETEKIADGKLSDEDKLREQPEPTLEGVETECKDKFSERKDHVEKELEKIKAKEKDTEIIADEKLSDEDKLREQPEPTPEGVQAECKDELLERKENVEKELEKTKARKTEQNADGKLSDEVKVSEQPEPTPEGIEAEYKDKFSERKEHVEKELEKIKAKENNTEIVTVEKVLDEDKLKEQLILIPKGVQVECKEETLERKESLQEKLEKTKAKNTEIVSEEKILDEDKLREQPQPTPEGVEAECKDTILESEIIVENELENPKVKEKETNTVSEEKVSDENNLQEQNKRKENVKNKNEIKSKEIIQNSITDENELNKDTDTVKKGKRFEQTELETEKLAKEKDAVSVPIQDEKLESEKNNNQEKKEVMSDDIAQTQKFEELVESQGKGNREPVQILEDQTTNKQLTESGQEEDKADEAGTVEGMKNKMITKQKIDVDKCETNLVTAEETITKRVSSDTEEVSKKAEVSFSKSLGNETVKEKQTETEQIVDYTASENVSQGGTIEYVEEQLEKIDIEKKSGVFEDENIKTESEIKVKVMSGISESSKVIGELADNTAEEIKKAAFEEIATMLKVSEESQTKDIQTLEEKVQSTTSVSEEDIIPQQKKISEATVQGKVKAEIDGITTEDLRISSETEVKEDIELSEKVNAKTSEQVDLYHEIEQKEDSLNENEKKDKKDSESDAGDTVKQKKETVEIEINASLKQENLLKTNTECAAESDIPLQDVIITETEDLHGKSEEDVKANEILQLVDKNAGSKVSGNVESGDIAEDMDLKKECSTEAVSEKLSVNTEFASVVKQDQSVFLSTERKEETVRLSAEQELIKTDSAETLSSEKNPPVESISASEHKESVSVKEESRNANAVLENAIKEKQVKASENIMSDDGMTTVESMAVREETLSAFVSEQVDGTVNETISITKTNETLTSGGQRVETMENVTTLTTLKEEYSQDLSKIIEQSETKEAISEQRQHTLASRNSISDMKEDVEMVLASSVEDSVVDSFVTSSLETAKVTESRETVREFVTNDDEIEEMRKEILEDLEITSAECGKYLMGSHEDISTFKDTIEKKPDEEEIEKETTNRYMIDDALMFC